MLEHHAKFDDDAATAILSYLKRYPKPICLIAHNGNGFDFPIIKQSFEKVKKVSTIIITSKIPLNRQMFSRKSRTFYCV